MTEDSARPRSIDELRQLAGLKWNQFGTNAIAAWVADMDLAPPDFAIEAVRELTDRADFGYNRVGNRIPELFCQWQQRRHGWAIDQSDVVVFNDVMHAIETTLWLHLKPGQSVALLTPIYPPFPKAVIGARMQTIDVPLNPDGWRLDADLLRDSISPTVGALLLCNPHNPTGRVFDRAEREAIAQIVIEKNLILISDEVWGDLTHPGSTHVPMAAVGDQVASRTITISSASKSFNLAGLRCASAHIGSALRPAFDELPPHFLGAVSSLSAAATLACWSEGDAWLDGTASGLTDRRNQLAQRLAADLPKVKYQIPDATYLAWLDFGPYGLGLDPAAWLLENASVALSPGPDFGVEGQGYARLNHATSPEILDEIIDRIVAALAVS